MSRDFVDKQIASAQNDVYRTWIDCLSSKGIKKHGLFFLSGEKAVRETIEKFPHLLRSLVLTPDQIASSADLIAKARAQSRAREASSDARFSVVEVSKDLFRDLDVSGTKFPLLLLHAAEIPEMDLSKEPEGLEVLCSLGDPANVGALLRSAAAFGASKVILLQESASPFHPKAVRSASANTLTTKLLRGPSIKDLGLAFESGKAKGPIVALDMFGTPLRTYTWPKSVRVLVGEEGVGVPQSKAFTYVSIAMQPDVESLNATVATSIALHSYYSQVRN